MEIKRTIYNKMAEWKKETNGTKALLIEGARRVGKSTVAEEFAQNEYKSYILIDFNMAKKKIKDAFESLDDFEVFFQTCWSRAELATQSRIEIANLSQIEKANATA